MFTSIVPLPVSDTEPGPSSFPTLVTHFSCVYRLGRRGERGEGEEEEEKEAGSLLLFAVSRWSGSFRPLFQGRASFLAAGQGETKDKLQRRGHHVTLPT